MRVFLVFNLMFLMHLGSLGQTVTIEIKNEIETTISAIDGENLIGKISVSPSKDFQNLTFPIPDLSKSIKLRVDGKSRFIIRNLTMKLNDKTEVNLEGTEIRASLFLQNFSRTKYMPNGNVELSSPKTYDFVVRLPAETYFNYRSTFKNNWEKAVIIRGSTQRYALISLSYESFGKEEMLYAHYLPARGADRSISLDSMVFYIPSSFTENIKIKVNRSDNCFKIRSVELVDNSSALKKLVTEGVIKSKEVEIMINAKDECLTEHSDDNIVVAIGEGINILKYLVIFISAVALFFANNFIFSPQAVSKWDRLGIN